MFGTLYPIYNGKILRIYYQTYNPLMWNLQAKLYQVDSSCINSASCNIN